MPPEDMAFPINEVQQYADELKKKRLQQPQPPSFHQTPEPIKPLNFDINGARQYAQQLTTQRREKVLDLQSKEEKRKEIYSQRQQTALDLANTVMVKPFDWLSKTAGEKTKGFFDTLRDKAIQDIQFGKHPDWETKAAYYFINPAKIVSKDKPDVQGMKDDLSEKVAFEYGTTGDIEKKVAEFAADPRMWPFFFVPETAAVRPALRALVSTVFTGQMLAGTYDSFIGTWEAHKAAEAKGGIFAKTEEAQQFWEGMQSLIESGTFASMGALELPQRIAAMKAYGPFNDIAMEKYGKGFAFLDHDQKMSVVNDRLQQVAPSPKVTKAGDVIKVMQQARTLGLMGGMKPEQAEAAYRKAQKDLLNLNEMVRQQQARDVATKGIPKPPEEAVAETPAPEKVHHENEFEPPVIIGPQMTAEERTARRQEIAEEEARQTIAREKELRDQQQKAAESRQREFAEEQRSKGLPITDSRTAAPDVEAANAMKNRIGEIGDLLDREAELHMFVNADEMLRSLREKRPRGRKLEPWEENVMDLADERDRLRGASDPLAASRNFAPLYRNRAGLMVRAVQLDEAYRRLLGMAGDAPTPEQGDAFKAEAINARDMAENLRDQATEALAAAAQTSEQQVYPVGAPVTMIKGKTASVILPNGKKINVAYAVVPLRELVTSHDPLNNFETVDAYPAPLQPRDYKNNRDLQVGVVTGGQNPETALVVSDAATPVDGPPIIREDGVVAGGNGRTMRLKMAYKNGHGEMLRDAIVDKAESLGIDREKIPPVEDQPVLVRVLTDDYHKADDLVRLGQDLNRDPSMGFDEAEQAVAAGQRMPDSMVDWFANGLESLGEDSTPRDFMRAYSNDLIEKMTATDMIPANKRLEYVTRGNELTERGKGLFENALLGKVIKDPDLLATIPRSLKSKIARSVSQLMVIKAKGGAWDITDRLEESLRLWKRIDSISDHLNEIGKQSDSVVDKYLHPDRFKMGSKLIDFGDGTVREIPHSAVEAIAKLLERSGKDVKAGFLAYARDAEGTQGSLGLVKPKTPVDAFNDAIGSTVGVRVKPEEWGTVEKAPEPKKGAPAPQQAGVAPVVPEAAKTPTAAPEGPPAPLEAVSAESVQKTLASHPGVGEQVASDAMETIKAFAESYLGIPVDQYLRQRLAGVRVGGTKAGPNAIYQDVPESLAKILRDAGAVPLGTDQDFNELSGEDYVWFNDPQTGSTLVIKTVDLTPEKIKAHLEESRKAFAPQGKEAAGGKLYQAGAGMSEAELVSWVKRAGSKIRAEKVGEQASLFGDSEAVYRLKNSTTGEVTLALESQIDRLSRSNPALKNAVSQSGLFEMPKTPEEEDQPAVQQRLFQASPLATGFASDEELARTEKFWKVTRLGIGYLGKKPDAGTLRDNEAVIAVKPDGTMRVQNSTFRLADTQVVRMYGNKIPGARALFQERLLSDARALKASDALARAQGLSHINKGATEFLNDGRAIVHIFQSGDASTVMHEMFHVFRRDLKPGEKSVLENWLKITDGKWEVKHEEKAARAWERYIREGKAPTEALKPVFERLKNWLMQVYHTLKGSPINIGIPEDVRAVFDRMLGGKGELLKPPEELKAEGIREEIPKPLGAKTKREMAPTPKERASAELVAKGGNSISGSAIQTRVFPNYDESKSWTAANKDKINGIELRRTKNGKIIADFVPKDGQTLYQSEELDMGQLRDRIKQLNERLKMRLSDSDRVHTSRQLSAYENELRQRLTQTKMFGPTEEPKPGEVITLWTPEESVRSTTPIILAPPEGVDRANLGRTPSDVASQPENRGGLGARPESAERPISVARGGATVRGVRTVGGGEPSGQRPGRRGEFTESVRNVPAARVDAPKRQRGPANMPAEQWKKLTEKLRIPDNAPVPTVRLPENIRRLLIFPGQREVTESILSGLQQHDAYILASSTGTGKCLAPGTPILMFDGTIKKVEELCIGDLLMGPDSRPRRVRGLAHGFDNMYRVVPVKGDPYEVNAPHILALELTPKTRQKGPEHVEITVADYLQQNTTFKHRAKGYRVGVEFSFRPVPLDPYFLGLWLGDGCSIRPSVCKPDPEIREFMETFANRYGLKLYVTKPPKCPELILTNGRRGGVAKDRQNPVTNLLRQLGVWDNKHIPHAYKVNCREVRLQLLAGLLDTDGSLSCNGFDFISKEKHIADDVAFLARSLGLAAYVSPCTKTCGQTGKSGIYYRVFISGPTHLIPTRIARKKASLRGQIKDVLRTGIKIEPVGFGEYFGFEIDGDGLFLLGDFTVTHNTYTAAAALTELHKPTDKTLILTQNKSLINAKNSGWIAVAKNFGLDVKALPAGVAMPNEPGIYISTYMTAIGRDGMDSVHWNNIVFDEVGAARRWYESKTGATVKAMAGHADKVLYMSATPFHTALEVGHMDKLGLWDSEGFEPWGIQFGVYRDKGTGLLGGGNAPRRLVKLRQQLIERGQYMNLDRIMEGWKGHFSIVPMDAETQQGVHNIVKAFRLAQDWFEARGRVNMVRAVKGNAVTFMKNYLERQRLPQAIELGRKLEKEGWKVLYFSENKAEVNEIFEFLKPADEGMNGEISRLLPKLPGVTETLQQEFGDKLANFSGSHSAAREAQKDAFLSDAKKHLYATYAAGGIGVSLHDTKGNAPRAVIYLGLPWSGVMFDQAIGRPWRFGTRSNVKAIFMLSDARPEVQLALGKVAPRLASLRAVVSGIHETDPLVGAMSNLDRALSYDLGNAHKAGADEFLDRVSTTAITNWKETPIESAESAKNKGMKFPGMESMPEPPEPVKKEVEILFQSDSNVPNNRDLPENQPEQLSEANKRIRDFLISGQAPPNIPGANDPLVRATLLSLPDPERIGLAFDMDTAARAEARTPVNGDPYSAQTSMWRRSMEWMRDSDLVADVHDFAKEGVQATRATKKWMFSHGRQVVRSLGGAAGLEIADRMIPEYHIQNGIYGGDIAHRFLDVMEKHGYKLKPSPEFEHAIDVKEGNAQPLNAKEAAFVADLTEVLNYARKQLEDHDVALELRGDDGTRLIPYSSIQDDPKYFPRRYPKDVFRSGRRREKILQHLMSRGYTRQAAEDRLLRMGRDYPLAGHVERAREHDIPGYRKDPLVIIQYADEVGEAIARKEVFGQQLQKLEQQLARVDDAKDRSQIRNITEQLLTPKHLHQDARALTRFATDFVVLTKMPFSALPAMSQMFKAGLYANNRALATGIFRTLKDYHGAWYAALESGSILDSVQQRMMREMGVGGIAEKALTTYGFNLAHYWGRIVADQTARVFLEKYALPKLIKDPKSSYWNRILTEKFRVTPEQIQEAIGNRQWSEEALNRAAKANSDLTQFTYDQTEVPPTWSIDPKASPKGQFAEAFMHTFFLLQRTAFRNGVLLKDALFHEMMKGNFRPLLVFMAAVSVGDEALADLYQLAHGDFQLAGGVVPVPDRVAALANPNYFGPGNLAKRELENLAFHGGLGMVKWVIDPIRYHTSPYEVAAGPFYGQILSSLKLLLYDYPSVKDTRTGTANHKRWLQSWRFMRRSFSPLRLYEKGFGVPLETDADRVRRERAQQKYKREQYGTTESVTGSEFSLAPTPE